MRRSTTIRFVGSRLLALLVPLALSGGCYIDGDWDDDDEGSNLSGNDSDFGGAGSVGPSCAVGAPGCSCTTTGACDEGLTCVASIDTCVLPPSCPIAAAGCACTEGGTCDPGLLCRENYCVSEDPCLADQAGTESCQCTQGGACDPGLDCLSGVCVDTSDFTTGEGTTGEPASDPDSQSSADSGSTGETPAEPGGDATSAG